MQEVPDRRSEIEDMQKLIGALTRRRPRGVACDWLTDILASSISFKMRATCAW